MYKFQVASYVTEEQQRRIKALAEMEKTSISAMVAMLIDEAYELNFTDNEDDNDRTED